MAEKFFWADYVAERIVKEKGKKAEYVCASGITPSGTVHIGNFREVITTELVVRALKDKGKKVRFIYSWDDFDRFRKIPSNVEKSYEKYIGMPLSDVPSPFEKGKSYAEHFEKEFEKSLKKVGIKPEFIYQNKMNKKRAYSGLIKTALEKRDEIKKILNKYRKEPLGKDWYPISVYCEKCKKDSTKIISAEGYTVEYVCSCGFKHKIDIRKEGLVSAKWRVSWPMRWKYEKVDFEPGGIDHSVEGGSFTTAKEIVKAVFHEDPPIYQFYDWVKIKGGKEFSSSSGNVVTLNQVEEIYEPEVLRFLFVGTKPKSGFQISFDNDVIKLYDDYDELERKYYEKKATPQEKRIYELSNIRVKKKKPNKLSFRHLITLVQVGKTSEINEDSTERAKRVKNWLNKYAGNDMKFTLQKKPKIKFKGKEKEALKELKKLLESKEKTKTEEDLFNGFYEICKKTGIKNTDFFKAAYMLIIGKEKGPRLASLVLTVGKEKVINLLDGI